MSKRLQQIQAKARELALSGTFIGWRPIAFTLQFEEGFAEAFDWIYSYATREELDSVARMPGRDFVQIARSLDPRTIGRRRVPPTSRARRQLPLPSNTKQAVSWLHVCQGRLWFFTDVPEMSP
jgi:hypothetical protein